MSCGDCDICCKVFRIEELDSPKGEYCKHCDKGCSIHETRPDVCRGFECGYLTNGWKEDLRPDNCGVIVQQTVKGEFEALQIEDEVSIGILAKLESIRKSNRIEIKEIDAR